MFNKKIERNVLKFLKEIGQYFKINEKCRIPRLSSNLFVLFVYLFLRNKVNVPIVGKCPTA